MKFKWVMKNVTAMDVDVCVRKNIRLLRGTQF